MYFHHTEAIAGIRDARFQTMMPDALFLGKRKSQSGFLLPKSDPFGTWTGFEASHFTTVRCRFTMIYPGTTRGDWSLHRGWTGAGFAGFGMDFGVRCEGNRVLEMLFPGLDDQISMVSFGVFLLMSQFQKSLDGSWYPTHFCVFIASIVYPFVQEHQIPFRKFRFLPATHACFINLCYMWVFLNWRYPEMDGLFHGRSQSKVDDDGGYPHDLGNHHITISLRLWTIKSPFRSSCAEELDGHQADRSLVLHEQRAPWAVQGRRVDLTKWRLFVGGLRRPSKIEVSWDLIGLKHENDLD